MRQNWIPLADLAHQSGLELNAARMAARRKRFKAKKIGRDWFAVEVTFWAWFDSKKIGRPPKK